MIRGTIPGNERRVCEDHGGARVAHLDGGIAQLRNILAELDSGSVPAVSS